jgi:phospholipid/cholesterol/gamma-HCH transport system substrate-binding protein
MTMPGQDPRDRTPYKRLGFLGIALVTAIFVLVWLQFRGVLTPTTQLTLITSRSGLVMDPGSKVTYNGVQVGRVTSVHEWNDSGTPKARIMLGVVPKYVSVIPANAQVDIKASTVFGNKYVAFSSPDNPVKPRITSLKVVDASSVTTEINTVFETITSIAQKVDPIKLNQTLTATAQALDGLGDKFGQSLVHANTILDDINPQMPQIRYDFQQLGALADTYSDASPDLWAALRQALTTARTLNQQRGDLDQALLASAGVANTGADILERGGPYFVRGFADAVPTSQVSDTYSPELFCTIRNFNELSPILAETAGGNGYSGITHTELAGAANPYVYPDNLPRINARGGPEGRPGCWQEVTRDMWPAPYLVMDTGASIAPYNHLELGQPILTDYVWGRQVGENTINP